MALVIKGSHVEASAAKVNHPLAFNFTEMSGRADEYLEQVKQQAAEIVSEAHREAAKVRQNAEAAGRAAAEQAIHEILDQKVAKQMETLTPAIKKIAEELTTARGAWQKHWEESALQVALAIAARIVGREVAADPSITESFVREALELAAGSAQLTLRLNPGDFENLRDEGTRLIAEISPLAKAEVVADPKIQLGGCVVDTQFGQVDMQVESQLAQLAAELT